MKLTLRTALAVTVMAIGFHSVAQAQTPDAPRNKTPEINGSMANSAVALLGGAMLIARSRRRS